MAAALLLRAGALRPRAAARAGKGGGGMQVFVRAGAATLSVDVAGDATVAELRAALQQQHPAADAGHLMWQDQLAADHLTLADLGAGAEAVFTLMAQAAEWQPREDVEELAIHVRAGAGVPGGLPVAERVRNTGRGRRVTVLGPTRPAEAPVWEWRIQIVAAREYPGTRDDGSRDVNLYVGLARPGIDLARADKDGLYGCSRERMSSELWLVVNDACWTNADNSPQQGWRNVRHGDIVIIRHSTDGTITFRHIVAGGRDEAGLSDSSNESGPERMLENTFGGATGELCPLVQFDRVGAGAALLYAGPPSAD